MKNYALALPLGGRGKMNDPEETRDDDTDRPDSSPDSSAFNDPDFKTELIMDSLEAIDAYSLNDTILYPFTTVLQIPTQLAEDWARAFSRVCKTLITALELPEAPDKNAKVMRAAKWYSAFPQVILRQPGRVGPKNLHILQLRLHQFLNGNYKSLISHTGIET